MKFTRRELLKITGVGAGAITLGSLGINYLVTESYAKDLKIKGAKEVESICPFCAVSCRFIAHVKGGKVVSTEGDPGYPISEGALCAKGATMNSMVNSDHRVVKPMYRAPFSEKWKKRAGAG